MQTHVPIPHLPAPQIVPQAKSEEQDFSAGA
jgi:hypothetical protein